MSQYTTTRVSLLMRMRDGGDTRAWDDFLEIYGPIIYRYGRRNGLQDADAADLTQDVLVSVFDAIDSFEYDRSVGRFRGWLTTVAFHALLALKRRKGRLPTVGGSAAMHRAQLSAEAEADSRFWDDQYVSRLFRIAAERVQERVQSSTWEVFAATTLRDENPQCVAERLGLSIGNVYVAKARVSALVKTELKELSDAG